MVYLDLDELPALVGRHGLFSSQKYAARSLVRRDHLFDAATPLATEVRDIIHQQTGQRSRGPIRLLTQLRYFGYYMSPLNLYYAFDERGTHVEYLVAEVNNTPWGERHCYVLWEGNRLGDAQDLRFSHSKQFHVSPFMPMDMTYFWRLTEPGSNLQVKLTNSRDETAMFDASMTLQRSELSRLSLWRMTIRYPWMTAQISAAIYCQALKLWWKKCPFYKHPNKRTDSSQSPATMPNLTNPSTPAR